LPGGGVPGIVTDVFGKDVRVPQGYLLWFTGLSGAGKSTVAGLVEDALRARGAPVERLDGDEVRLHLSKGLGFSREDRDANVLRIGWVASLLARHGVGVVTAAISPYAATRDKVRAMTEHFLEVFVDAPLEECIRRDVKGLYRRALEGEIPQFTGVSDPYEAPAAPELHLRTDREAPQRSAQRVLALLEERGLVPPA
jgi:adenylylsulfate kinase